MAREWKSAEYHRLSDPQFGWGLKVIKKLTALSIREDAHILDAGCGTGRVTAELLKTFPKSTVTAIDASENMVNEARKTLADFAARVTVERLDLLDLALAEGPAFDVVFSTAVFHWIRNQDRLFANLFRALRPGGLLLAQCGGGPNLKVQRERTDKIRSSPEFARFFENWERVWEYPMPEVAEERLRRAGFTKIQAALEPAPVTFPDEQTYRDFCSTVILGPYMQRLTPELQSRFLDLMVRESVKDDPPFTLDYWRLNLQAYKPAA